MVAVTDPFVPPDSAPPPPPPPPAWGPPPVWGQQPPPWGQPQPWYGGWQPAPKRTNGRAIAALVTGILALVPVAIGLAIGALVQIRRRDEAGKGLAIGGLAAAGVWTLLLVAVIAAGVSGAFDVYPREGDLSEIASTEVGTCLQADPPQVSDCSTPHDYEVYFTAPLPGTRWQGEEDIDSTADDICYDTFDDYVGTSYDSSSYDYTFFAPSRGEWSKGRHEIVCVVVAYDDDYLTGSVKDSGD